MITSAERRRICFCFHLSVGPFCLLGCLSSCLFVSEQPQSKSFVWIFMKILPSVQNHKKENRFPFERELIKYQLFEVAFLFRHSLFFSKPFIFMHMGKLLLLFTADCIHGCHGSTMNFLVIKISILSNILFMKWEHLGTFLVYEICHCFLMYVTSLWKVSLVCDISHFAFWCLISEY